MKNLYKALDHYRKLFRSGSKIAYAEISGFYWLVDGYAAHKVPVKHMDINPAILKPFPNDLEAIIQKAESGQALKETSLIKNISQVRACVPYQAEDFTIWFDKALLSIFGSRISLLGTGPVEPAAVQRYGETIGIVLPVRCPQTDISMFL